MEKRNKKKIINNKKKLKGILITNAHGQEITKNVKARYSHVPKSAGFDIIKLNTGGSKNNAKAL